MSACVEAGRVGGARRGEEWATDLVRVRANLARNHLGLSGNLVAHRWLVNGSSSSNGVGPTVGVVGLVGDVALVALVVRLGAVARDPAQDTVPRRVALAVVVPGGASDDGSVERACLWKASGGR